MLIVDGEFSGLDPQKHSLVSVGALDFNNPENQFYMECRIWDGAHISDEALEVNGFTENEITDKNKKTEGELVKEFIEWSKNLKDRTLAGQSVSYDMNFLKAGARREGLNWDFAHRDIDIHSVCYAHMIKRGIEPPFDKKHKHSDLDLDGVLNYVGIPNEPEPHNALTGALSHAECLSRLLNDKKLLPEFKNFEIPWEGKLTLKN